MSKTHIEGNETPNALVSAMKFVLLDSGSTNETNPRKNLVHHSMGLLPLAVLVLCIYF